MEKSPETVLDVAATSVLGQDSHLTPGDTPLSPADQGSSDVEAQGLPDDHAEQTLEAGAGAQRDGEDLPPGEDGEPQDADLLPEERIFLREFPMIRAELEMAIREHRQRADDIDRTHHTLARTGLVTSSLAVVSGTVSILGLALAPVTAGGSLMLSAAGQGLGTVAGAAGLATSILEFRHRQRAHAQVGGGSGGGELSGPDPKVKEAVACLLEAGKTAQHCGETVKGIRKHMQALKVARAHPRLAAAAERLLVSGEASTRTAGRVRRAFDGTPLALGGRAFLRSSAWAGLFLGMDVGSLLKDWRRLRQGAGSEAAGLLRARAEQLERRLAELTQRHESLRKLLQEKSPRSSSSEGAGPPLPQPPAEPGEAGAQATATAG